MGEPLNSNSWTQLFDAVPSQLQLLGTSQCVIYIHQGPASAPFGFNKCGLAYGVLSTDSRPFGEEPC